MVLSFRTNVMLGAGALVALALSPLSFWTYMLASFHILIGTVSECRQWLRGKRDLRLGSRQRGQQYAVVTGASSGIGKEIATYLAKQGFSLILVARSVDTLNALAKMMKNDYGVEVHTISRDLSVQGTAQDLHKAVKELQVPVCVLVNNAGVACSGWHIEVPVEKLSDMMNLMVTNLTLLTRLFAEDFVAAGGGSILQIASIAGLVPNPYQAVYGACKAFIISYSMSIDYELRPRGVTVTTVSPGATLSGFAANGQCTESILFRIPGMQMGAKTVARRAVRAMLGGERHVVIGWINVVMVSVASVLPTAVVQTLSLLLWRPLSVHTQSVD